MCSDDEGGGRSESRGVERGGETIALGRGSTITTPGDITFTATEQRGAHGGQKGRGLSWRRSSSRPLRPHGRSKERRGSPPPKSAGCGGRPSPRAGPKSQSGMPPSTWRGGGGLSWSEHRPMEWRGGAAGLPSGARLRETQGRLPNAAGGVVWWSLLRNCTNCAGVTRRKLCRPVTFQMMFAGPESQIPSQLQQSLFVCFWSAPSYMPCFASG